MYTMSKRASTCKSTKGESSSSEETVKDRVRNFGVFESETHRINYEAFVYHPIHSETEGGKIGMANTLRNALMVRNETMLLLFWPSIGDGKFTTRSMVARMIRDPRVRLSHHCIATTIAGHKDSTHQITLSDLFFLYCIFSEGVVCNIPFWLGRYLNGVRDGEDFKKKSLVTMEIIIELVPRQCNWVTKLETQPQQQEQADEEEEADDDGVGGSVEAYREMSRRDWQAHHGVLMDQQDER
ncbi:hypothetical protein Tco_0430985 [Tanacetum coccineum]